MFDLVCYTRAASTTGSPDCAGGPPSGLNHPSHTLHFHPLPFNFLPHVQVFFSLLSPQPGPKKKKITLTLNLNELSNEINENEISDLVCSRSESSEAEKEFKKNRLQLLCALFQLFRSIIAPVSILLSLKGQEELERNCIYRYQQGR